MAKEISINVGDKFGRLILIDDTKIRKRIGKQKCLRIFVKCKCECGDIRLYRKDYLLKGASLSCGCLRRDLARKKGKDQRTENGYLFWLYGEKKRNSIKQRNIIFNLLFDDFCSIIKQNCYWCGDIPQLNENKVHNLVGIKVPINTIDRLDSNVGYELNNCVACCLKCNTLKSFFSSEEFLIQVKKVYEFNILNV